MLLDASVLDLARRNATSGLKNARDVRLQVGYAVRDTTHDHNAKRKSLDVLLKLKIAVERDKDIANAVSTA